MILALDLEDALAVEEIKTQLQDSKDFLAKHKLDIDRVSKFLAGIRGVTLGITFDEKPFGKIKVDFKDDLQLFPVAKAALIQALANHGDMINEFEDVKKVTCDKHQLNEKQDHPGFLAAGFLPFFAATCPESRIQRA